MGGGVSVSVRKNDTSVVEGLSQVEKNVCVNRHAYILSRAGGEVVPREDVSQRVNSMIKDFSDPNPVLILAQSGAGKSTLIASILAAYSSEPGEYISFSVFVGATERSTASFDILAQLNTSINKNLQQEGGSGIKEETLETNNIFLMQNQIVESIDNLGKLGKKVLLFFDAVNELDQTSLSLTWLPLVPPSNCKYVFSTIDPESIDSRSPSGIATASVYENLNQRWKFLSQAEKSVYNLTSMSRGERRELFVKLVAKSMDPMPSDTVDIVLAKPEHSPLYLHLIARALLLQTKMNGEYNDDLAKQLLSDFPNDIPAAFDLAILYVERNLGAALSNTIFTSVWATDGDLFLSQLQEIAKDVLDQGKEETSNDTSVLNGILKVRSIGNSGFSKINFVHMQARDACQRKYLSNQELVEDVHSKLGDYFLSSYEKRKNKADFSWKQILRRLPIHLLNCSDSQKAEAVLCDLEFCAHKCHANLLGDLLYNFRQSVASGGQKQPNSFNDYHCFLNASAHVLRRTSNALTERMLLQQAFNSYDGSKAQSDAEGALSASKKMAYFEWLNRPRTRSPCHSIYTYPDNHIWVGDFSRDAKYIAFGCSDCLVHVIESENGDEVMTMEGHTDDVTFLRFNPKHEANELVTIASCRPYRKGNDLIVWNIVNGSKIQIYDTLDFVTDMKFSPSGEQLAIVCSKSFCKILTKSAKTLMYEESTVFNVPASCCTFTTANDFIVIGTNLPVRDNSDNEGVETPTYTKEIYLFEAVSALEGKKRSLEIQDAVCSFGDPEDDGILAMCTSRFDGSAEYLVCATGSSKVKIWNLQNVKNVSCVLSFMPHQSEMLYTVSCSACGKLFISAEDKTVSVWNVNPKEKAVGTAYAASFRGHSAPVKGVSQHPANSGLFMTNSDDGTARIYSLPLAEVSKAPPGHVASVSAVVFCQMGSKEYIASADGLGNLKLFESDCITEIWNTKLLSKSPGMAAITSLAYCLGDVQSEDAYLAVGMHSTVHVVCVADGTLRSTFHDFPDWINSIEYFRGQIIAGGDNNCLQMLSVDDNGTLSSPREFDTSLVENANKYTSILCVSVGSEVCLSGANDNFVRVWNAATLTQMAAIELQNWVVCVKIKCGLDDRPGASNLGLAGVKGGFIHMIDCSLKGNFSILTKISAGGMGTTVAWCSFLSRHHILANSSDKTMYLFEYGESASETDDNSVLKMVGSFPSFAPFGSPDGIGGQASIKGQLVCCGDQGGRLYLAKVHLG